MRARQDKTTKRDRLAARLARGSQPGRANGSGKLFTTESQPRKPGRPKGALNYYTRNLKDAVINACTRHGEDGNGKGGLDGYMFLLARDEPKTMAMLLRGVLPTQIMLEQVEPPEPKISFEELQQQLAQLGFVLERAPLPHQNGPEIVLDASNDTQVHTNKVNTNECLSDKRPGTSSVIPVVRADHLNGSPQGPDGHRRQALYGIHG